MKKRSTTRLYGFCVLFSLCYKVTRLGIIRRCFNVSDGRAANEIIYNKRMEFNLINSIAVQCVLLDIVFKKLFNKRFPSSSLYCDFYRSLFATSKDHCVPR